MTKAQRELTGRLKLHLMPSGPKNKGIDEESRRKALDLLAQLIATLD